MKKSTRVAPIISGIVSFILTFLLVRVSLTRAQVTPTAQLLLGADHIVAAPNTIVNVGIGLDSGTQNVTGIDAVLQFDSSILQLTGAQLGATTLQTLVPGTNNALDLAQAVSINATDSSQSTISLGLLSFNQATDQLTASVSGQLDPLTNPLVTLTFQTLQNGQTTILPIYTPNGTNESNIISLDSGTPQDIMASPSAGLTIFVATVSPTPTPSPSPTSSPSSSPTPTPMATPTPLPSSTPTPSPTPTPSASPSPSASPVACVSFDFNNDHVINVADIMLIAYRWNTRPGSSLYDAKFDLNQNNWIDIADVQTVANSWNTSCP